MAVPRRALLATLAAAGVAGVVPTVRPAGARDAETALYLSGGMGPGGVHYIAAFDGAGRHVFAHSMAGRGHAVAVSRDRRTAVMCARRPGRFATVVDLRSNAVVREIEADDGRHFYGHAAFSVDGSRLYTTENAYALGEGRVGVYDAQNGFRRLGEWPTHGIGPHELRMMPDGRTLVVANGGILTHPDSGREKLNLDAMEPSVVFIDALDGALVDRIELPQELRQLSTRHLATSGGGTVAVVMQYEGPETDLPPLVGLIEEPGRLRLVSAPEPVQVRMANYCGSVAFDGVDQVFAVSSPRGSLCTFWSIAGDFLASVAVADGCGVAGDGLAGGFALTSGLGEMWRYRVTGQDLQRFAAYGGPVAHWDNHLTAI